MLTFSLSQSQEYLAAVISEWLGMWDEIFWEWNSLLQLHRELRFVLLKVPSKSIMIIEINGFNVIESELVAQRLSFKLRAELMDKSNGCGLESPIHQFEEICWELLMHFDAVFCYPGMIDRLSDINFVQQLLWSHADEVSQAL